MITITYNLNGEEKSFEASLPYSFIGVYQEVPLYLCKNYNEFISFGKKNKRSLKLIPCFVSGEPVYKNTSYTTETYDPEIHKDFEFVEPEPVERTTKEAPKTKGKKRSKLREKKTKKKSKNTKGK